MLIIVVGAVVGIVTSMLGVGWLDGDIPLAMATNIIPIAIVVAALELGRA